MDRLNCKLLQFHCCTSRMVKAAMTILLCASVGCQTWQKSHELAVTNFASGDLRLARTSLEKSQKSFRAEQKLLELDHGVLDLANGDVTQAENRFRHLRRELEVLEQKDLAEQTASMLTDSRAVAFSGRDFERRMVLNMALMTSMLGDGQDSFAYSLQVTEAATVRRTAIIAAAEKQHDSNLIAEASGNGSDPAVETAQVSPASYQQPPLAAKVQASPQDQPLALSSYLAAVVQSETPSRSQETEKAIMDTAYWNPTFHQHDRANSTAEFGTRCQPGNGTLHVIALVGKAPRWVSESAEATSAALLIADRIISITGKHTLPPTLSAVKIARPEPSGVALPRGALTCGVAPAGASAETPAPPLTFSTVVDLNAVAQATYQEHRDEEIAAAVARRVMKKGAVYVLKETQHIHRNSWVDLGVNVAGVVWEGMEKPDTRSWRMLPARIDIARTELPAGDWTTIINTSSYRGSAAAQVVPVHIEDGRNTFVVCIIPEHQLTGHILVGGADHASIPVR